VNRADAKWYAYWFAKAERAAARLDFERARVALMMCRWVQL